MPRIRPTLATFAALLVLTSSLQAARSIEGPRSGKWAHEESSLAPDPDVIWGRLDNGVRYALLPHHGVPGRVALRYVVLTGSMDERPDEAGIAHFTEHMAFRGTPRFSADEMVALFQRLGVEYGSDVNAVTSHDYTSYMLDYRENTPDLLREGLQFFRGIGDGPTFDPATIEQERRVIMAEMRSRGSLAERQLFDSFPLIFRGLSFAQHTPIGTIETLNSLTQEDFKRFHARGYRPDLTILVAAGDFDPAAMIGHIRASFGDMSARRDRLPARSEGRLDSRGLRAGIFRISGVPAVEVLAASVVPPSNRADSLEAQTERQRRGFVMQLFQERLSTRVPGVGGAQAEYQRMMGYEAGIAAVGGGDWAHGVLALDQLIRNTHQNGFDALEVERLRRRHLRLARHLAAQVPTLDPLVLCEALTDSITGHTVFTGLASEQQRMAEWLETFTAEDATETFRGLWNPENLAFHISGGVDHELEPREILERVEEYRRAGLSYLQPTLVRQPLPPLRPIGEPTPVVERREVPELGAVLVRFENNVRFNFVSSQQEPGIVRAVVRVGSGLVNMPGRQPALKEFGLDTVLASGTGRTNAERLSRMVEERLLGFSFDLSDRDAFTFRGEMGSEEVDIFLGIVAEFLSQPRFASYAHDSQRAQAFMSRGATTTGFQEGMREVTNHLFQGDARFTWGTPLDYISLSVVDVRRWIEPALTEGYVEVTLVGDLTEEAALAQVSRTLGALGLRKADKSAVDAPPAEVTAPAGFKRIEFLGEHHLGLVVGDWPVTGTLQVRDQAALTVLAKVLEQRVRDRLRDGLGLTYSPSAHFETYEGFDGLAMMQAMADCAPTEARHVAETVTAVAAKLAAEGVTEGEFIGSRGILTSQLRRAFGENGFLVSMLQRAQEKPQSLEEAVALRQDLISTVTREEVNAWASRVLPADNSRTFGMVPKAFIGVFQAQQP